MIRRPDKMSRAAPTAASSIVFIISAEKVCDGAKSSLMAASFHIADRGSQAAPGRFTRRRLRSSGNFLKLGYFTSGKEIGSQRFVKFRNVPTNPFESHGNVFDLFIHVVLQNRAQLPIRAGFGPLPIPIDGFELFHH